METMAMGSSASEPAARWAVAALPAAPPWALSRRWAASRTGVG
ncbi:hypothetical protein [Streptomyces bambusae]|nr:hypothetical protein [Streptomyces bambusae]